MTWGDAADQRETQRRVDAAISRAIACHMSDAKWIKLFDSLRGLAVGPLRWKFIRNDRVFVQPIPPAAATLETRFGDVLPYPYGPFREIEWVEIPAERATGVIEVLIATGRFPIEQRKSGLRVVAYEWSKTG